MSEELSIRDELLAARSRDMTKEQESVDAALHAAIDSLRPSEMANATDPLVKVVYGGLLAFRVATQVEKRTLTGNGPHDARFIAAAITAAGYVHRDDVLADPTIVRMERVVAEDIVPADLPDRIVTYISECRITPPPDWQTAAREAVRTVAEAHQWDDLYRIPEVKG